MRHISNKNQEIASFVAHWFRSKDHGQSTKTPFQAISPFQTFLYVIASTTNSRRN